MKSKFQTLYMDIAARVAKMSHARRLQVGAIVVKDDRVISMGYNGMPAGWDNNCEDMEWWMPEVEDLHEDELAVMYPHVSYHGEFNDQVSHYRLRTKREVLHAESNAISKLAKSTESGDGASLFVTHSPCIECAKLIYQSGISKVFYRDSYRDDSGINFLEASGVTVTKLDSENG